MRSAVPLLALVGLLSGAALAAPADEDRSIPAAVPTTTFAVSTERVKVDVVVRDKKDRVLRGLTAADPPDCELCGPAVVALVAVSRNGDAFALTVTLS